jgi:hypothetical protein
MTGWTLYVLMGVIAAHSIQTVLLKSFNQKHSLVALSLF